MRKELVCPRCGGVVFWHIRALEEHAVGKDKPFAVTLQPKPSHPTTVGELFRRVDYDADGNGYFELLVCQGCNHVEWYACDFEPGPAATQPFACPSCGGAQAWGVERLDERTPNRRDNVSVLPVLATISGTDGHYSLAVCSGCGYTAFTAHQLDAVSEHRNGVSVVAKSCTGCGAKTKLRIGVAMEQSGTEPLHLARQGFIRHDVGKLSPEICRSCGATDWWALELSKLREDAERGVVRLDGEARDVVSGGPYR